MICTKENRYGGKLNQPGDPLHPVSEQDKRLIVAMGWGRDETPEEAAGKVTSAPVERTKGGQYKRRDMRAETLQGSRTPPSENKRSAAPAPAPKAAPAPAPAAVSTPAPTAAPGSGEPVGLVTSADFKAPDSSAT